MGMPPVIIVSAASLARGLFSYKDTRPEKQTGTNAQPTPLSAKERLPEADIK